MALWDDDIKNRKPEAIENIRIYCRMKLTSGLLCNISFMSSGTSLKPIPIVKEFMIIGDIPLYVAMDSADVWAHHEQFELDERKNPINVAGVPPDLFSEYGQRWGNPHIVGMLWRKMILPGGEKE